MINYNELKPKNNKVIVTGPHLSGTELCAKALANDLDYTYLDEDNFTDYKAIRELIEVSSRFVLRAPGLCHLVHTVPVAVVMMIRPFHEIVIAENKIGWNGKTRNRELLKYGISGHEAKHKIISIIKYDYWYRSQRSQVQEAYEVDCYSVPGAEV